MTTLPLPSQEPGVQTQMTYLQTVEFTVKVSTYHTGRFTITSSRGRNYFMVLYDHYSNAILVEPLTSHSKRELIRATRILHSQLSSRGLNSQYQILDNEFPGGLKYFCAIPASISNSFLCTCIAPTPPNAPSKPARITSSPASVVATLTSPYISGTASFLMPL